MGELCPCSRVFSKVEETICLRLCFIHLCERLVMVRWALQTSSLDCCSSWSCSWMQKLLMADLTKSSQCHPEQIHLVYCANGVCSAKILLVKICVPDWNLRAWEPPELEILFTSSKYKNIRLTFSIVRQWGSVFWVLTAKQVGTSTLSSRALAAILCCL